MDDIIPLCNGKIFNATVLLFVPDDLTEEVYIDNIMTIRESEESYNNDNFYSKVYKI